MTQAVNQALTFTQQVYQALAQALAETGDGCDSQTYQLYQARRYPSQAPEHEIAFDVAIERLDDGPKGLTWLWGWACMDQATGISVDDVNTFRSTLNQVDVEQIKGGIATTGVLTREALQAAMSQELCVMRLMPAERVKPLLYRPVYQVGIHNAEQAEQRRQNQVEQALTKADFTSVSQTIFAMSNGHYFNDLKSLLSYELATALP